MKGGMMKKYKSKTDYTTIECNREVSHKITHILKTKKQGIKKRASSIIK